MRPGAAPLLIASLFLLVPGSARAQTVDIERFAREVVTLPDVVVDRLEGAIRKARGTGIELVRTRYELVPDAALEEPPAGAPGARLGIDAFSTRVTVPIPLGSRSAVLTSASYDTITFRHEGFPDGPPADRLHEARIRSALLHVISDRWRFLGGVDLAVLTDFRDLEYDSEHLELEDLQAGALLMFEYEVSKHVSVSLGAGYSTSFGLPLPLPAGRVSIHKDAFRFEATLPGKISVGWVPTRRLELGLRGSLSGSDFHLRRADQRLGLTTLSLGPYGTLETLPGLAVDLQVGVLPWRRIRLDDDEGNEVQNLDVPPTWFLRAELAFEL